MDEQINKIVANITKLATSLNKMWSEKKDIFDSLSVDSIAQYHEEIKIFFERNKTDLESIAEMRKEANRLAKDSIEIDITIDQIIEPVYELIADIIQPIEKLLEKYGLLPKIQKPKDLTLQL